MRYNYFRGYSNESFKRRTLNKKLKYNYNSYFFRESFWTLIHWISILIILFVIIYIIYSITR